MIKGWGSPETLQAETLKNHTKKVLFQNNQPKNKKRVWKRPAFCCLGISKPRRPRCAKIESIIKEKKTVVIERVLYSRRDWINILKHDASH